MKEKPLVTVVIALYNTEQYIEKCIDTVIKQTYVNIEIIIVNDGSTDSSAEKCQQFLKDNRIRLINKPNGGLSSARQAGFEVANGRYICFIDADDYLETNYVEIMLNRLVDNNADVCVCYSRFIKNDTEWIVGRDIEEDRYVVTKEILCKNYIEQCSMFFLSDSWNKMYNVEFLKRTKVKFELPPKMNGSDLAFNHKIALHCPTYTTCSEVLYNHLIIENSAVRRKGKKLLNSYNLIMVQLLEEAKKIKIISDLKDQLLTIYIRFLRDGLVDAMQESTNASEMKNVIHSACIVYSDTLSNYPVLKNATYLGRSKSLDLFNSILGHEGLMLAYLYMHQKVRKLLKK